MLSVTKNLGFEVKNLKRLIDWFIFEVSDVKLLIGEQLIITQNTFPFSNNLWWIFHKFLQKGG